MRDVYDIHEETRKDMLAKFLLISKNRITQSKYDKIILVVDNGKDKEKFIVCVSDEEADEACKEAIERDLWSFNADFIANHSKAIREAGKEGIKAIQKMQEILCESANPIVKALIDDIDEFVEDAKAVDGRGHFLTTYDGEEYEYDDGYIYLLDCDPNEIRTDQELKEIRGKEGI